MIANVFTAIRLTLVIFSYKKVLYVRIRNKDCHAGSRGVRCFHLKCTPLEVSLS